MKPFYALALVFTLFACGWSWPPFKHKTVDEVVKQGWKIGCTVANPLAACQ